MFVFDEGFINGEKWKKVYNYRFWPVEGKRFDTYYSSIREVGKKVYAIAKGSNRQRLLYDFDLKEGNIVRCGIEGILPTDCFVRIMM